MHLVGSDVLCGRFPLRPGPAADPLPFPALALALACSITVAMVTYVSCAALGPTPLTLRSACARLAMASSASWTSSASSSDWVSTSPAHHTRKARHESRTPVPRVLSPRSSYHHCSRRLRTAAAGPVDTPSRSSAAAPSAGTPASPRPAPLAPVLETMVSALYQGQRDARRRYIHRSGTSAFALIGCSLSPRLREWNVCVRTATLPR